MASESSRKDFFISYASPDRSWAEWIAWELEAAGYKTVIQAWDFTVGSNFVLQMQRASRDSDRTLIVLSPAFLKSNFTQLEWSAAFSRDPEGERRTLVPVRVADCNVDGLLGPIVYVDLVGLSRDAARDMLIRHVGVIQRDGEQRLKPLSAPPFPADLTAVPFPVVSAAAPSLTGQPRGRFVHTDIRAQALSDLSSGHHPYHPVFDATDISIRYSEMPVFAYVFVPHSDYVRTGRLQPFTPAAAVCVLDPAGVMARLRQSLDAPRLQRLESSPSSIVNEEKEALINAIAGCVDRAFMAAVMFPRTVLEPVRRKPEFAYRAISAMFVLPLAAMHHKLAVPAFHVTINSIGECSTTFLSESKKAVKAIYGGGKRVNHTVSIAGPDACALCGIARLVGWAAAAHYNNNNSKWIALLENALK